MRDIWQKRRGALSPLTRESTASARASTAEVLRPFNDEELAAFLDGRLGARERSQMMAHLAESDDAYEVFACAAVMLSEGDALLEKMQTAEFRTAMRRAFDASPDALRQAAIAAARSSEG